MTLAVSGEARKKVYYSRSGPRSREGQTLRNPSMQHWRIWRIPIRFAFRVRPNLDPAEDLLSDESHVCIAEMPAEELSVHREGLTRLGIQLRVLGAGVDPKFGECDRIEAAEVSGLVKK
jgi:hypothetical protein